MEFLEKYIIVVFIQLQQQRTADICLQVALVENSSNGILKEKKFLDKNDKNKLVFAEMKTENNLTQKSFIEKFLSSMRSKMYGKK